MALHIQMSEEAEAQLRRNALRNKLSSMAACLLFMVLGGGILYTSVILIAGETPVEFLAYTSPQEDAPPTNQPTTPELTQKQQTPSHDVAPSLIVSNAPAAVAMAQVEIDNSDFEDSMDFGIGLDIGGLGDGLGSGGNGLGSSKPGGSALEGTFYDLKLTRSGSNTPLWNAATKRVNEPELVEVLNGFLKNWNEATLNKYYKSPIKLYASNFYLPAATANYAPIAYQCEKKCAPSGWIAIYRGRVRAPKSGKFRFVGTGDDFLAVRFNHKTVLEAGYRIPSLWTKDNPRAYHVSAAGNGKTYQATIKAGKDRQHPGYEFIQYPNINIWNREVGGLTAGTEFTVKEGEAYPIEIAISEIPGGLFGFVLFIQDVTNGKPSKVTNLDLFRTNFSMPNKKEITDLLRQKNCLRGNPECPAYNEDSPIWTAVP